VKKAEDAVMVDYGADVDFSFDYLGEGEMSVWVYMNGNRLVCEICEN
jgi:hypothetical protein